MKQWMEKIKNFQKEQILILLLLGALLLVIAIPTKEEPPQTAAPETDAPQAAQPYALTRARQMEQRLKEILSRVEGIGQTEVMLTLKSEGKKIIEKDLEQSQGKEENQEEGGKTAVSAQADSSENTVYQRDAQGNEIPYVTEELEPEIAGVLVIAQGAGNSSVVAEITEAVMALFGVEAHKIKVMKME